MPRRFRPAEVEAVKFPTPAQWTWDLLEQQVTLKDMQFRYIADYPRKRLLLPRQGEHTPAATEACAAIWDLLHRTMTRADTLDALTTQWEPMRYWRLLELGLPSLTYDSTVGLQWIQRLEVYKHST